MNHMDTAAKILKALGGDENVQHLEHCSTRLRVTLVDDAKANINELKSIPGVLGVNQTAQCQIILGTSVVEVYAELKKLITGKGESKEAKKTKKKFGAVILDFVISIFQPLIPAIAGGGILKSILLLLSLLAVLDKGSDTYKILNFIGDAPLYFLPILVAFTTANKLKVNPLVAVTSVAALLTPKLAELISGEAGAAFLGMHLQTINYAYQVFPAILSVLLYAQLEKLFTKISPKVIRIFFVPLMSLLITVPTTLLILGPLGFNIGQYFVTAIMFLYTHVGWLAIAILAAVLPFMVATGMHKAMIPYVISSLGTLGKELIYNIASLAHNISECGACFAVAIRAKDKTLKAAASSAGISALFGITEPALYGVTLLNKRVLYGVMIGAFCGGAYMGLNAVESYVAVGPGLASLSMFISQTLPNNIIHAIIGFGVSLVVSFIAVIFLWKETVKPDALTQGAPEQYTAPAEGKLISLSEVKDNVFSSKVMGDGIAVIPSKGEIFAPADGVVDMVYEAKHCLSMTTETGAEIMIHIGLDTAKLEGKYFNPKVAVGQKVKKGEQLMTFELANIVSEGYDPTVVVIVTNRPDMKFDIAKGSKLSKADYAFAITQG